MFRRLLIPTDGSRVAEKAVTEGVALARALGAEVTILTVLRPFHAFTADPELVSETAPAHRNHEEAHKLRDDRLAQEAGTSGVRIEHLTAEHNHLSDAVIRAAADRGCDLVVMPAHDRPGLLSSSHVDTETVRLLARSELPVLVLH